jgi:hypothetical protein
MRFIMKSTLKFCLVLFLLAVLLLTGCTPTPSPADDESGEDTTAFETEDLTTGDEETTGSDETTGSTETDDGTGRVTSLRLDLGEKVGDEITVFSIEAFHLEVDS